jgi:hypothetical protein
MNVVLPIRPGQAEPYRRFLQELQGSRREDFAAFRQRWGLRSLAIWLAPARAGGVAVVQVELAENLATVAATFARSPHPFDRWLAERVGELHGVDLGDGIARYRAELLGAWAPPPGTRH